MRSELSLYLSAHQPQVLDTTFQGELLVRNGLIWLTVAGSPEDVFLRAGQRHSLPKSRRAVVEAVHGEACVMFRAVEPAPLASRLLRGIGSLLTAWPRFVNRRWSRFCPHGW